MLCAHCGESIDSDTSETCPACGKSPPLAGRFALLEVVGQGEDGVTYRGRRIQDDEPLAIKEYSLQTAESIETIERFERESVALEQLSHPGIPNFYEDLVVSEGDHQSLYLIQEFFDGKSLDEVVSAHRFEERDVAELLYRLLDILAYLHQLTPPVVHGDVQLKNVMWDGERTLALVDFGNVKEAVVGEHDGTIRVGRLGYAPPEMYHGEGGPPVDVYGAAATAVALLSRADPGDLVDDSHELEWAEAVEVGPSFGTILEEMLAPDRPNRLSEAEAAMEALHQAGLAPSEASDAPESREETGGDGTKNRVHRDGGRREPSRDRRDSSDEYDAVDRREHGRYDGERDDRDDSDEYRVGSGDSDGYDAHRDEDDHDDRDDSDEYRHRASRDDSDEYPAVRSSRALTRATRVGGGMAALGLAGAAMWYLGGMYVLIPGVVVTLLVFSAGKELLD